MKNLQGLIVRYLPATRTLGARVRITYPQLGTSRVVPYNYAVGGSEETAATWLATHEVYPAGCIALGKNCAVLVLPELGLSRVYALFTRSAITAAAAV